MVESTTGSKPSGTTGADENTYGRVLEYASSLGPTARELSGAGAYSAFGGVVTFGRGLRSLRRGKTGRGLWRLAVGGLFIAIAVAQRRSRKRRSGRDDTRDEDYTDVLDSGSDIEDVSDGIDTDDRAGGDDTPDPTQVAETGPDIADVDAGSDTSREDDVRSTVDDQDTDETDIDDTDPVTTGVGEGFSDDQELDAGETTDDEETNTGDESDETASENPID